jgi:predicted MPP superfamily phosphohydrolase
MFLLFLAVIQFIITMLHWFVSSTLAGFAGITPSLKLPLKIGFIILSFSFLSASMLVSAYPNAISRTFYLVSASWLSIFYFLLWAAIFLRLLIALVRPSNPAPFAAILVFLAFLASVYGFIRSNETKIKEISVEIPGLPSSWADKKAVWVSDLHLGGIRGAGFASRITNMTKDIGPDIVFVGGDLFDGSNSDPDRLIEPFRELNPPLGIYFITGNHEEFSDPTPLIEAVRRSGMQILDNRMVILEGVQIAGVDYASTRDNKRFSEVLEEMEFDPNIPSILLRHAPDGLETALSAGIDFQISGHSHRGQVFPLNGITRLVWKGYDYGLKKFKNLIVYTSSGAGTWGPPARFGTDSEIVLIRFNKF